MFFRVKMCIFANIRHFDEQVTKRCKILTILARLPLTTPDDPCCEGNGKRDIDRTPVEFLRQQGGGSGQVILSFRSCPEDTEA